MIDQNDLDLNFQKEVDVGLAADIGTLSRLPKIVGNMSAVREWAFTTQEFSAEDALRVGFVSKVVAGGREETVGMSFSGGWCVSI